MNLINLELENMEISRNLISRQCNLIKFSNVTDIYVVQKRSVSSSVVFGFGSKIFHQLFRAVLDVIIIKSLSSNRKQIIKKKIIEKTSKGFGTLSNSLENEL